MTEIILTLESGNLSQLQDEIMDLRNARESFDIIEFRGDYYNDVHTEVKAIEMIRDSIDKPILYTYRTEKEGGRGTDTGDAYITHLATIQKSIPVEYIDVEVLEESDPSIIDQLKRYSKVIMSHHDFSHTPTNGVLEGILEQMESAHGDFYKVAYTPETIKDVERVVALLEDAKEKYGDIVTVISMGELGKATRISRTVPPRFTYGTLNTPQAPGQYNTTELRKVYGGKE